MWSLASCLLGQMHTAASGWVKSPGCERCGNGAVRHKSEKRSGRQPFKVRKCLYDVEMRL